jgi:hypothetical protein
MFALRMSTRLLSSLISSARHTDLLQRTVDARLKNLLQILERIRCCLTHIVHAAANGRLRGLQDRAQRGVGHLACASVDACAFGHQVLKKLRCAVLRFGDGAKPGEPYLMYRSKQFILRYRDEAVGLLRGFLSGCHVCPLVRPFVPWLGIRPILHSHRCDYCNRLRCSSAMRSSTGRI